MTITTDNFEQESAMTEITILPDGRVFVFGTSRPILEVLHQLEPNSPKLLRLLQQVRDMENNLFTTETRKRVGTTDEHG